MSTRATILIKGDDNEEFRFYHHWDGYPEGVGKDLKKYLSNFRYWYAERIANDLVKGFVEEDSGYEITSGQHGDENYAYLIDCEKHQLKCYRVGWDEFDWKDEKVVEIPD